MQDFKKLQVWQKAHRLVLQTYAKSAHFPREEQFGLTSQIRRAAVSIAANIAEGSSRSGDCERSVTIMSVRPVRIQSSCGLPVLFSK